MFTTIGPSDLREGDVSGITSGGIKPGQLCHEIAKELFPMSALLANKFGTSVKNQIVAYI